MKMVNSALLLLACLPRHAYPIAFTAGRFSWRWPPGSPRVVKRTVRPGPVLVLGV